MKTAEEILKEKCWTIYMSNDTDTITDILNAMNEFANQSKWISVNDRVPEVSEKYDNCLWSEYVLVLYKDKSVDVHNYDILAGCFNSLDSDYITHWQPLPEKP